MLKGRTHSFFHRSKPKLRLDRPMTKYIIPKPDPSPCLLNIRRLSGSPFKMKTLNTSHSKDKISKPKLTMPEITHKMSQKNLRIEQIPRDNVMRRRPSQLLKLDLFVNSIKNKMIQRKMVSLEDDFFSIREIQLKYLLKAILEDEQIPEIKAKRLIDKIMLYEQDLSIQHKFPSKSNQNTLQRGLNSQTSDLLKDRLKFALLENQKKLNISRVLSKSFILKRPKRIQDEEELSLKQWICDECGKLKTDKPKKGLCKFAGALLNIGVKQSSDQLTSVKEQNQDEFEVLKELQILLKKQNVDHFKEEHLSKLQHYFDKQANSNIQIGLQGYRQLQVEMIELAEDIKAHPQGVGLQINRKDLSTLDKLVDMNLNVIVKDMANPELNEDEKAERATYFIRNTRKQYDRLLNQMTGAVQQKTVFINKTFLVIQQWSKCFQDRKKYLQRLRDQYCSEVYYLYSGLRQFKVRYWENTTICLQIEHLIKGILKRTKKMDELILLGNCFY